MHRILMFAVCFALAIPPEIFEPAYGSAENVQQELLQNCQDDGATITESETEEPELYFHGLALFEHNAQFDGCLNAIDGSILIAVEVDPQGRRPPPGIEFSTFL